MLFLLVLFLSPSTPNSGEFGGLASTASMGQMSASVAAVGGQAQPRSRWIIGPPS